MNVSIKKNPLSAYINSSILEMIENYNWVLYDNTMVMSMWQY